MRRILFMKPLPRSVVVGGEYLASGPGAHGVVRAPLVAQLVADLTDRGARAQRLAHRRQEVLGAVRGLADTRERELSLVRVPLSAYLRRPLELPPLGVGIEPVQLDRLALLFPKTVDADDDALARLDLLLVPECGLLDLVLDEAPLDRRDRSAELVDSLDQLPRLGLQLVGQRLDEVRAAERIGAVGAARLRCEDLLRAQRDLGRTLRRQRKRFVEPVRVQRLRAAGDRGERLDRDAHDVVLRLLRRQRRAAGLRVEAQRERLRVRRAEPLAHHPRPQAPRRAELRNLLEEVVVRVEEEGEALAELVRAQPR